MLVLPVGDWLFDLLQAVRTPQMKSETARTKLVNRLMGMREIVANATCSSRNRAHKLKLIGVSLRSFCPTQASNRVRRVPWQRRFGPGN